MSRDWHGGETLTLLVNVNARRGATSLSEATTLLRSHGLSINPVATSDQAHADAVLAAEVRRGAPAVIVGGGDGTLSHAAALLLGSRTALAVLPLGTGNTFARSVGVPLNLWDAAQIIVDGKRAGVDVGQARLDDGPAQLFLNSVGLGFSAEIARQLTTTVKRRLGLLAWPLIGARVLLRHHALDLRVQVGSSAPRRVRTHQLLVANGRYVAGPLKAAPDATVDDHRLDVLIFGGAQLRSAAQAALNWASGRSAAPESTRQVSLSSRRGPVWVSLDGEVSRRSSLELSIQAGALRVLVPEGFDASEV